MDFRKMMRTVGGRGPSIETVLVDPHCQPGGYLEGQVQIIGGADSVDVEYVAIGLTTRVRMRADNGGEYGADQEFHRQRVTGSFRLEPDARHDLTFRFEVPWQTPVTEVNGQHLAGSTMGLSTELEVARAVERSDLDPVAVHPLPAQERILDGLLRLGFRFGQAVVERGRVYGADQHLPLCQHIQLRPAPAYAAVMQQLELIFLPTPEQLQVVLEVDRRDDPRTKSHDAFGSFDVDYATIDQIDWVAQLDERLHRCARRRGLLLDG